MADKTYNDGLEDAAQELEARHRRSFVGDSGRLGEQEVDVCLDCHWAEGTHGKGCRVYGDMTAIRALKENSDG